MALDYSNAVQNLAHYVCGIIVGSGITLAEHWKEINHD